MEQYTGVSVKGHIKIFDPSTGEVIIDKDNAINFEAMSMALAYSLGNQGYGWIKGMVFGNGATAIDNTGLITYLPPNVSGTTASLYNKTYSKILNGSDITVTHTPGNLYSDLLISCNLAPSEPQDQEAFDNDTNLDNQYTFDELGLITNINGQEVLISHVVFHPVQKSMNREIQIDYTIRIQALTTLMTL